MIDQILAWISQHSTGFKFEWYRELRFGRSPRWEQP